MVVGNSGTELAPAVETPLAGLEIAGLEVASGLNVDRFGFVTMQRVLGVWTATLRGVRGVPLVGCGLGARGLTCRRTPFGSADESEGDD